MTAAPPDLALVHAAVDRALAVLAQPGRPHLPPLEAELRGHLKALLPVAETAISMLWPGSLEWCQRRERLDMVRAVLNQPPPSDPLAAHGQVRQLARNCTLLLAYTEGTR